MIIQTIETIAAIREQVKQYRAKGETVALVPTMGALHDAHFALVEQARKMADRIIVSIFVNPAQFGPNEDFDRYPRLLDADIARLDEQGADIAYAPNVAQIYPDNFKTGIQVTGLNKILCAVQRPQFFDGVALVVNKLFMQCQPDIAIFGEKDYQQLLVIRQMVRDLDIPVKIESLPTVREEDGLALSSRNRYLSEKERAIAPEIYRNLQQVAKELPKAKDIKIPLQGATDRLKKAGFKVEYLTLCDATTLEPLARYQSPARLLVAAHLGKTRLIDNIAA